MIRRVCLVMIAACSIAGVYASAGQIDQVLEQENAQKQVAMAPLPTVDDLTFLRRASVDLIGRIPAGGEIREYMSWPAAERRQKLVDKLLAHDRFADRWTAFYGDLFRLRTNADGGAALTAYVHQAIDQNMPYDELCRRLIAANGKAGATPEAGFVLGDNADPMALAAVASQVFMGIRISCAQCHDHPFDVWTREDFYGLAAYFGKTRRIESQRTNVVYTTETNQSTVLWPPEDEALGEDRKPMKPTFPFAMIDETSEPEFIARLVRLRAEQERKRQAELAKKEVAIDTLLAATGEKAQQQASGSQDFFGVVGEAKSEIRSIDIKGDLYRHSELRTELAEMITSPRNKYFARSFVNRLWKELIGRGIVEPVDDFRADNPPTHPETLDFLAAEFVASGFDFRHIVRMIVTSDVYQRSHTPDDSDELARATLEQNFLATPMRRMLSESLYDSIVTAGHLFDVKHPAGANERIIEERVRVAVNEEGEEIQPKKPSLRTLIAQGGQGRAMMANGGAAMPAGGGYKVEQAIELDFASLLAKKDNAVMVEQMEVMSAEELEAQRMLMEQQQEKRPGVKYVYKTVQRVIDDNPSFNSAFRMAGPANFGHFLRVFGQTSRQDLGEERDDAPTMRQALMMLNGQLTNEAARVGPAEPMYALVAGEKPNLEKAVQLAYVEILTRQPTEQEVADALEIIGSASDPLEGVCDLRWVLLNCNEFRFLP